MIGTLTILNITTLGRFEIRRTQDVLAGGNWNRRKVCELFKLLVTAEQHRLHREQIQEMLWPSFTSEQAANSFGKTLYLLRRALEPELPTGKGSSSNYLTLDHDTLVLVSENVRIDADLFEVAVKQLQGKMRNHALQTESTLHVLLDECDSVLSLYGGDYLPEDLYDDWAQRRRDRLRRIYCWLLENTAQVAIKCELGLRACEYLQALLERNPADEQTHRQLMLIFARMGRRSDALNQFLLLREALREELNAKPLSETIELYRAIQEGHIGADLAEGRIKVLPDVLAVSGSEAAPSAPHIPHTPATEQTSAVIQPQEASPLEREIIDTNHVLNARLVGRAEELQKLQYTYEHSWIGRKNIFVISGEPGIGKTRLAREFIQWVGERYASSVLWGHCYELNRSLPYQPIIEVISASVRNCSPEQLRHILGSGASDLAKIIPEIRLKLPALPGSENLGPEVERRNLYNAVARFFHGLAAESPWIVVLDDLQWADSATIQLLGYLFSLRISTSATEQTPFYLLLYRADEVSETHPLRELLASLSRYGVLEEARLKRLEESAVQQLLVSIAGHEVRPIFTSEIYKYTEGNPFFIGEALLSLIRDGKLKKIGERWQTTVSIDELALPQSVRLLIERRLVQFLPECRTTLAMAAVLGRQFNSDLLCQARHLSEDAIAGHVDEAIQAHILIPLDNSALNGAFSARNTYRQDCDLAFTHDKIREVLYQWLNPLRRRSMHRQAAQAIEAHYASRLQPYYSELAYHYQIAEDYKRAVDYFLKAADHASTVYAFVDAAGYMERAIDLLLGDEDQAERAELLRRLTEDTYLYIGRPDKAIEAGMASCTLWRNLGNQVMEARARLNVAFAYHWQGRESSAVQQISRALECLQKFSSERQLLTRVYVQWGLAATVMGDTLTAREKLEMAEKLYQDAVENDPFVAVVLLWTRSWYAFLAETPSSMLDYALRGAEVCRSTHRFGWEPMMGYSSAWAYMLLGRISEARHQAHETLEQAQRHNVVGAQGWAYLVLAFLAIHCADWDEAERCSNLALQIGEMLHDIDLQARVFWSRSVCAGWLADWQRAHQEVAQAIEMVNHGEQPSMIYPHLLVQAAKACFYANQIEEAQQYLDQSLHLALERRYRQLPAVAYRLQGRIFQAKHDFEAAQLYLEQALTETQAMNDEVEYARTQEAYGLFYLARAREGDEELGASLLATARRTFQQLGVNG